MSVADHRARLRALYAANNQADAATALDTIEKRERYVVRPTVKAFLRLAPVAAGACIVAFALWHTHEPLTNWTHTARVLAVVGAPWLAQLVADHFAA